MTSPHIFTKKRFSRREFIKLTSGGLVLVSSSLWLPRSAWAATVTRYVRIGSSGGDGTTNNTSGSTAAYASLSAWASAEVTNLTTDGDSHIVYCDGTGGHDTTAVSISSSWNTGASNTLTIAGNTGTTPHDGTFDSGYVLDLNPGYDTACLTLDTNYVILQDFEIEVGNGYSSYGIALEDCANALIQRMLIYATTDGGYQYGILAYGGASSGGNQGATIQNSIFSSFGACAIWSGPQGWGPDHDFTCYSNSTVNIGGTTETSSEGHYFISAVSSDTYAFEVSNCLGGSSDGDAEFCAVDNDAVLGDFSGDYNFNEDTTAPGANSIDSGTVTTSTTPGAGTWAIVNSLTAGAENMKLVDDSDSDVLEAGVSSGAGLPSDDVLGNTRGTSNYDIGAHQVSTAVAGSTPHLLSATGAGA